MEGESVFGSSDAPYDANGKVAHSHRVHVWQDKPWKTGSGWNARCFDCSFGDWGPEYLPVFEAATAHIQEHELVLTPFGAVP